MSDEPEETENDAEVGEGEGEDEGDGQKKGLDKKKLLIIAVPALLALGGGGYFAADMLGLMGPAPEAEAQAVPAIYYDLPEMVVNLSATEGRGQYLKLKVSLEADTKAVDALKPVMPRVLDLFQLYLRELRSGDLDGSAGIFRLKEELTRRINLELHPNKIDRVLFKEIIIQ